MLNHIGLFAAGAIFCLLASSCAASGAGGTSNGSGARPSGQIYYFADCQAGAQPSCVPGDDGNRGTRQDAPRRNLSGLDVNSLPAGSQLLFKRGGAFNIGTIRLQNTRVRSDAPLTLDAWGEGPDPILRATGPNGFNFGTYGGGPTIHGGYTLRNLKIDGLGASQWGLFLMGNVRDVLVENVELTGFQIAVHTQNNGAALNDRLTLRNVNINRNSKMGLLGSAVNLLVENSRFVDNNFSGSNFNHAIYLGGKSGSGIVRNNTFLNNSTLNGVCTGGNLTVHGQWDGLVIEGNTITQTSAQGTCYGLVVNGGYATQEWFRNLIVRGNTVTNVGGCGICLGSAPNALIEGNKIFNDQAGYQTGILAPSSTYDGGDDLDAGAIVRNNLVCYAKPTANSAATKLTSVGASESGTVYRTGRDATTGACVR